MISRCLYAGMLMVAPVLANAQDLQDQKMFNISALGFGYGYYSMTNLAPIGGNLAVAGYADLFISQTSTLNIRADYVSSGGMYLVERYTLNATTIHAQEAYSWRSVTLDGVVLQRVSEFGSVGIGVGADWMSYRRYSVYAEEKSFDPVTHEVLTRNLTYKVEWVRISPSVSAVANSDWSLKGGVRVTMKTFYKLTFPGSGIGGGPFKSLNAIGISFAVMYELTK